MSLRKVAKSVTVQYIGRVFGYVCSLGTIAIITRHLGVSNYGEYTTALAVASLIITMSDFGFFWSTIHNVMSAEDKARVVSEIAGIKFAATLLLLVVAASIVFLGNFSPAVRSSFWILSIFVMASSINNVLVAVYQSEYRMIKPTVAEGASRLVSLVLTYLGAKAGYGLSYFIFIVGFASVFNIAINWVGLKNFIGSISLRVFGYKWSVYYKTVFLLGLVQLFYVIFYRIDVVILSWFKSPTDVGIYGIVVKVTEIISAVSSIFVGALFPTLVESLQNDRNKFLEYVSRAFLIMLALALPIAILGQGFTEGLVGIIGGPEFLTTSTVVYAGISIYAPTLLSFALFFCAINYISALFYTSLLAAQEMRTLLLFNALALVTNFSLNVVFVPYFSYLTTTVVTVLTEIMILLFTSIFFMVKFKYKPPLKDTLGIVLSLALPLIYLSLMPSESFVIRFLITASLYFGSLVLLVPKSRNTVMKFMHLRRA